ncbi:MAG: tetratricopeptide repeat protein [Candidatus Marinimicrobia bacterium]|nr:tetratricopeptide repeat protein [Candidatus Neomarinimicrobiota bacterium]MCF7850995.1 tetratricopeptide repeat protein [Candidatus Neomarinimicrobiota bacterium]
MRSKTVSIVIMAIMAFTMVLSACMPPQPTPEELAAMEKARKDSVRKANSRYCMKHLSFATEYYKNKSYDDALYNYHKLFDYECVDEQMAPNVYVYMGNAYREKDMLDSAIIFYDQGLDILPDNKYLWESKIFALGMIGDDEGVLQAKVDMFAVFPDNLELGEEIAEDYVSAGMYEEAKAMAEGLLEADPENKNLSNIIREAVEATGGDVIGFLKKEYESNPSNISNAQEYGRELLAMGQLEPAINVLEGVLKLRPEMTVIIRDLVQAHRELGQTKDVISMLRKLNNANPDDIRIYFDMTEAYIEDGEMESAMTWANKALAKDKNNGQAYANRATVYEAVATECTGAVPDFDDKLVFMMAYEDYRTARAKGYLRATKKIDFLKEARIPQSGDWFFNRDEYVKSGKAKPKKDCYTWLKRSVTAPANN